MHEWVTDNYCYVECLNKTCDEFGTVYRAIVNTDNFKVFFKINAETSNERTYYCY